MKLKRSTNNIIILFSFVLVFFSRIAILREGKWYYDIGNFLHSGFYHPSFFTPFQLIIMLLLINLLLFYKIRLKLQNGLFIMAIWSYIFRMINPNSHTMNPILGLPLLSSIAQYLFLFLLIVLVSISHDNLKLFLSKMMKYVFTFSIIRGIILIILFLTGNAYLTRWKSYSIILDEPDTQFIFSFVGSFSFILYLIRKKKKFLFSAIFLLGITIFSVQRSTSLPGVLSVFFIMVFTQIKRIPAVSKQVFFIAISLVIFFSAASYYFPDSAVSFVVKRYQGTFINPLEAESKAFSSTGHFEQAEAVFQSILAERPFFGLGYGRSSELFLEGQTTNIHNAYAGLWIHHGVIPLLFYIVVIIMILVRTYKLQILCNRTNYQNYLLQLGASYYLIGYFFIAWFTPEQTLNGFRNQILWFIIFIFVTRFTTKKNEDIYEK